MITLTLAQLRSGAAYRADESVSASGRHTTADVTSLVNEALRKYHLLLVDRGQISKRTESLATAIGTTPVNGWPTNEFVALPADTLEVKQIALQYNGRWYPLNPMSEEEAEAVEDGEFWGSSDTGTPRRFRVDRDNSGGLIARLWPRADAVYALKLLYVPTVTALVSDGDNYAFHDGTEQWVMCDVALEMMAHDGATETRAYQHVTGAKREAERLLVSSITRLNRAGPLRVIDTRTRRLRAADLDRRA